LAVSGGSVVGRPDWAWIRRSARRRRVPATGHPYDRVSRRPQPVDHFREPFPVHLPGDGQAGVDLFFEPTPGID
jgi:hypothetical protein